MERNYVIVSTQYIHDGLVQFWGEYTPDDAKRRSYGGYTRNLDTCEKYTSKELKANCYKFPFYRKNMHWLRTDNFYIKMSNLDKLGTKMTVIYL
jgi:hypothetical protein